MCLSDSWLNLLLKCLMREHHYTLSFRSQCVHMFLHGSTSGPRRWLKSDIMCRQPHILYIPTHTSSLPCLQLLANVMLYLCAVAVGVMSYYMADRKYRTAFLEARQSLEVKVTLEEQSTQQVVEHTHTGWNTLLNEIIHYVIPSKHTHLHKHTNTPVR